MADEKNFDITLKNSPEQKPRTVGIPTEALDTMVSNFLRQVEMKLDLLNLSLKFRLVSKLGNILSKLAKHCPRRVLNKV